MEPSRSEKVLYPDDGFTKADVIGYFEDIGEVMLPHMARRFLTLHRFPDGIGEEGFYQQSRSDYFPSYVRGVTAPRAGGGDPVTHIVADDAEGLLYLADQATLAFHGWQSRYDRPTRPDRLVFDLDPSREGFDAVIDAARSLREALQLLALEPFLTTTGSRGLHVVAPLKRYKDFEASRALARKVARALTDREPNRFTLEQRKSKRRGRLYLDIGRNAYGQTAIVPYSLRALRGAPVATPLEWDELGRKGVAPRKYHLRNIRQRLAQKEDPWRDFFASAKRPRIDEDRLEAWARG